MALISPTATAPRYLAHFASALDYTRDADAALESRECPRNFPVVRPTTAIRQCNQTPMPASYAEQDAASNNVTCADLRDSRHAALRGVRIVVGITSAPDKWGEQRRNGIRRTWMQYSGVGRATLACFVVGRRGVKPAILQKLDAEQQRHGDLIFLRGTKDGQGPFVTISKLHAWFRLASDLLGLIGPDDNPAEAVAADAAATAAVSADMIRPRPRRLGDVLSVEEFAKLHPRSPRKLLPHAPLAQSVKHIAKVDDDTFVHLPVLQRELDLMHCHPHLYYGVFAYSGYNPVTFTKCGFDYGPKGGRYRKYNCSAPDPIAKPHGAAHPPFPWTSGAVMLASASLVAKVASDPSIGQFVARSADVRGPHQPGMKPGHNTDEDVALGFWFSRLHRAGTATVSYVRVNERLTNLGCLRNNGLYRSPKPHAVGVHFVKTAGGMQYVWGLLVDHEAPNVTKCHKMTGDYRL